MRQLTLLVVRLNPTFMLVHDIHQCLPRIDQLSYMNILRADRTVARGNDVAIREIQAGQIDRTTGQFYALFRSRKMMSLFRDNSRLHPA